MTDAWSRVQSVGRGAVRGSRRVARATARAGGSVARAGQGTVRGSRTAFRATIRAGRGVGQATRRLTYAQGAGRTGLGRLIELTAVQSAGDALITVSLAGALFFGLPVGQARGQVALYLLITMVPFAVVAPFVGPVLDRFRSGRRYVMAGTLFARGLLCWGMASAVDHSDTLTLLPAALGVLVLSKAFNVSRSAVMPSVLPADITLVTANARVALFSLVTAGVAAGAAAGLTVWLGPGWVLRGTMPLFLLSGIAAVRLPRHVDSPDLEDFEEDEADATYAANKGHNTSDVGSHGADRDVSGDATDATDKHNEDGTSDEPARSRRGRTPQWRALLDMGPIVGEAARANAAIRVQAGFLVFFLLFLVQDKHLIGPSPELTLGLLAVAAGGGGLLGAVVASWVRSHSPQLIVLATLAVTVVTTIVTALFFNLWSAVVVALVSAFAQGLGKLALDAIVQREIAEEVRSATFGIVEALMQVAWVLGGLIGLVLSLFADGPAGFLTVSAALVLSLCWLLVMRRRRIRSRFARHSSVQPSRREPSADRADAGTKPLTNPY